MRLLSNQILLFMRKKRKLNNLQFKNFWLLNNRDLKTYSNLETKEMIKKFNQYTKELELENQKLIGYNIYLADRVSQLGIINCKFVLFSDSFMNLNSIIQKTPHFNWNTLFNWIKRNPNNYFASQASLYLFKFIDQCSTKLKAFELSSSEIINRSYQLHVCPIIFRKMIMEMFSYFNKNRIYLN